MVLVRTPYEHHRHKLGARAPAAMLVRRGMQGVVQDMRGTFGSGGRFVAFLQEREGGLATAAGLREQAWRRAAGDGGG
ncbi:CocE/NonD family hydrolase [Nonomuraea angiospora]|nr:CocE/NonD family hydrolase [Nonomuraea angiospora]